MSQVKIVPFMPTYRKRWVVIDQDGKHLGVFSSIPEALYHIEEEGWILRPTNGYSNV